RHRAPSSPAAGHTRPSATDPRNRMTGAGAARVPRRGSARPRASAPALQFFCDQVLHRRVVQRQLGVHALEAAVLGLQFLDPLQVRGVHAAVLRLPLVVRRRADPGLPAQVLDRNPGITLLEDRDDLGLAELRLLHGTSWLRRCQKALLLGCPGLGEAYAKNLPREEGGTPGKLLRVRLRAGARGAAAPSITIRRQVKAAWTDLTGRNS